MPKRKSSDESGLAPGEGKPGRAKGTKRQLCKLLAINNPRFNQLSRSVFISLGRSHECAARTKKSSRKCACNVLKVWTNMPFVPVCSCACLLPQWTRLACSSFCVPFFVQAERRTQLFLMFADVKALRKLVRKGASWEKTASVCKRAVHDARINLAEWFSCKYLLCSGAATGPALCFRFSVKSDSCLL